MINDKGEIKISWNGYEVISTEHGENKSVWSALDTIRNERGQMKTMTRLQWKKYFDKK